MGVACCFPLGQRYDEGTLAATRWSYDSTKVHDPAVYQTGSSTTTGDQMLSGNNQIVLGQSETETNTRID